MTVTSSPRFARPGVERRVVREIGEHDRQFYWRDRAFDLPIDDLVTLLEE